MKIFCSIILIIITIIPANCLAQNSEQSQKQSKIALVIGNGNYSSSILANPENDARSMSATLEKLGFTVLKYENLNQEQMKRAIDEFGLKMKGKDVGLFFYAGNGIQSRGYNYLVPIDAQLQTEQDVEYDCVQADRILARMDGSGTKVNIIILDACRNNPFERSWTRSETGKGLAFMNAPSGTLIAYSTAPGNTASDGSGTNSPYTTALLESIVIPKITITQMFQNVGNIVSQKSGRQQIPWISSSLTADFYFNNDSILINPDLTAKADLKETSDYNIKLDQLPQKAIKIIQVRSISDTLIKKDTGLYVILNKGLESKVKPKNVLNLYSQKFSKSTLSDEELLSGVEKIGHVDIIKSYIGKSEGKIEFKKGFDSKSGFNSNLSYAIKKNWFQSIYIISKIHISSKSGEHNLNLKSTAGLGYSIYKSNLFGIYTEFIPTPYSIEESAGNYLNGTSIFFYGGLIKKVSQNTALKFGIGIDQGVIGEIFGDIGMINSLKNNFTIISGLSVGGYNLGTNVLFSLGIGYSF